jgi:hypothetical protein
LGQKIIFIFPAKTKQFYCIFNCHSFPFFQEIFFDFIKYSKGQLTGTSAYVEAMRECFGALWDEATQSLKRLNKDEWKTPPKEWSDCVESKLKYVQKNISAQKEFRKWKLLELCDQSPALKQMASTTMNSTFQFVWRS